MSHYCQECGNSGERGQSGMLDCAALNCTAATERAALDAHLLALGRLHERDLVWEAYKLGQAKAQDGWVSVEDRLPPKYEEVFVWPHPTDYIKTAELHGLGALAGTCWKFGEYVNGWGHDLCTMNTPPTHWRPLFAAPANNNTESKTTPVGD